VALGQVFSEYLGFPCQSSFHQLLHNHPHLSFGAGTIGQKWPHYKGLGPTPIAITKAQEQLYHFTRKVFLVRWIFYKMQGTVVSGLLWYRHFGIICCFYLRDKWERGQSHITTSSQLIRFISRLIKGSWLNFSLPWQWLLYFCVTGHPLWREGDSAPCQKSRSLHIHIIFTALHIYVTYEWTRTTNMQLTYTWALRGMLSLSYAGRGGDRHRPVPVESVGGTCEGNDPFHEHIIVVRKGT
jgi:hypothetical protein